MAHGKKHRIVADEAIRDEGTSYHYIAPVRTLRAPGRLADALHAALRDFPLPVTRGLVWTTDAPYRETDDQLRAYAKEYVLAVEMQATSLFALAQRKGLEIGVVAHVTNAVGTPTKRSTRVRLTPTCCSCRRCAWPRWTRSALDEVAGPAGSLQRAAWGASSITVADTADGTGTLGTADAVNCAPW